MTDRLFIYGTLAPGRPNEHVLAEVPGAWEPATVRAHCSRKAGVLRSVILALSWMNSVVKSMGSFSAPKSYLHIGLGWMSSRAMAMSASSRRRNSGTALLLRPIFMRSKEIAQRKAQRASANHSLERTGDAGSKVSQVV